MATVRTYIDIVNEANHTIIESATTELLRELKLSQLPLPEGRGLEEKMLTTSDQPGRKAID